MTDKLLHYIEGVGWRYDCDHSMTHRMNSHDYKGRSIYMLTLTLAHRSKPLLGTLRWKQKEGEEGMLPQSAKEREAVVDLTPLGKRVRDCWEQIPAHYPDVRTIILQIMPEHLHGVLFVTQDQEAHLGQIVKGFKVGCSKAWWALNPSLLFDAPQDATAGTSSFAPFPSSPAPSASSSAPSALSSAPFCSPNYNSAHTTAVPAERTTAAPVASAIAAPAAPYSRPLPHSKGAKGPSLFAPGYNDSVLMGEGQLANMIRYVQQNPLA